MHVPRWLVGALLCGPAVLPAAAYAQEPSPPPMTLHVYTDLLQVPVLVLDNARRPMVGLDPKRFRLSVDSGPLFQPPYVRREGDDALAVTVLMDEEEQDAGVESRVAEAVGAMAGRALRFRDSVSIKTMGGCVVSQTGPFAVTTTGVALAKAVSVANAHDAAMGSAKHCETHRLWDEMAQTCLELGRQPGRRVLLALTDGDDRGSRVKWGDLRTIASMRSVAIFAVRVPRAVPDDAKTRPPASRTGLPAGEPDALTALCELTGGVVSFPGAFNLREAMETVVAMVRERYILEFERPKQLGLGSHDLVVKVSRGNAFIRPAGISFPQADGAEREAMKSVLAEPGRAPEPGTRRVLTGPQ